MTEKTIIENHVKNLPYSVKAIYKTLRELAKKTMPGAVEMLYHNALGYSLTNSPWDRVCYIAHQSKGYVNFGFFFGADLPDPNGLIEGKGKRIRHVKVYTVEEAKDPALAKLVEAAWKKSGKDVADWRNSLKKKKVPA